MSYRIYLSPSTQEHNSYAGKMGSEEDHMQVIGGRVAELLRPVGITTFLNRPEMTVDQIIKESKDFAVHAHIAIHSNAGGGQGTEAFFNPIIYGSDKLAAMVYNEVSVLSPGSDRGVKDGSHLKEIRNVRAPVTLVEIEFHDNLPGAKWISEHHEDIARAVAKGICKYFNVPFTDIRDEPVLTCGVIVNGKVLPGGGLLYQGRAYVPLRAVGEEIGARVEWDNKIKTAIIRTER